LFAFSVVFLGRKQNSLKHTQTGATLGSGRPQADRHSEVGSPSCVHITHGNGRQKQKKLRKHRVKSVATPKHELKNWQFMAKQENLATNIDKLEQNRHTQRAQ
jgi:hypothetical protein